MSWCWQANTSLKANLPQVRYQYFDFHNECKKMRWDRISILVNMIQDELDRSGSVADTNLGRVSLLMP